MTVRLDIFDGIPLFVNLTRDELSQVAELVEVKGFLAGQVIFRSGDRADAFYVIARGKVRIDIPKGDREYGCSEFLKEGAFFGEMGVIRSSPRCADATVVEDAILLTVPKESFDELLATNADLAEKIMREFNRRVAELAGGGADGGKDERRGRVFVIYSAAGGVGTTFVACNLAKKIRDYTRKKTVLFDADFQLGTAHVFMNHPGRTEIGRLVNTGAGTIDSLLVTSSTVELAGNLSLVPAPEAVEESEYFTPEVCVRIIDELADSHSFVVVDTATNLDDRNVAMFEAADQLLVVLEPQICATTRLASFFHVYGKLGLEKEKLLLVLNKCDDLGFDVEELESKIRTPVGAVIGYDRESVMECLNSGRLLVDWKPDSTCGVALSNLARKLVSDSLPSGAEDEGGGGGIFSLWGLLG